MASQQPRGPQRPWWAARVRALAYAREAHRLLRGERCGGVLETLVHAEIDAEDIPVAFRYLEIEAADSVSVEAIRMADLGSAWQTKVDRTRGAEDEWLRSGRTAILRVPSVIAPGTWNFLMNPAHPDSAGIRVARVHSHVLDRRLLR